MTLKSTVGIGALALATGVILNEWTLAALFSSDGSIAGPHAALIWAADIFLISLGALLLFRRSTLTKERMLVFAGTAMIAAGLLFNERYIALLLNFDIKHIEILIVRIMNAYLILGGSFIVVFRKAVQLKNLALAGITSLLCVVGFLAFDFYRGYVTFRHFESNVIIRDTHVKDPRLGWKLKVGSVGVHTQDGSFDVTYEIDENGFKKINNTSANPEFSIYFFGDSFTFGGGVTNSDTFPNIIKEKYFTDDVNIYNAAVSGYGIVQMYQRFLDIEPRLRNGDIVVFSPISEDIERNIKDFWFPYFVRFTNVLKVDDYPYYENGAVKTAQLQMGLYTTLKLLAFQAPYTKNFWRSLNKKLIPDTTLEARDIMQRIKRRTELRGGRFALFFLPTIEHCLTGRYEPDISGFDYFDIMRYFPKEPGELFRLKFRQDKHWNAEGHKIAARAIVETLVREQIIKPEFLKEKLEKEMGAAASALQPGSRML